MNTNTNNQTHLGALANISEARYFAVQEQKPFVAQEQTHLGAMADITETLYFATQSQKHLRNAMNSIAEVFHCAMNKE